MGLLRRSARTEAFGLAEPLEPRALLAVAFGPMPVESVTPMTGRIVADFDGDGLNDLAGIDAAGERTIVFLRGRGDGTFNAAARTTLGVRATLLGAGRFIPGGGAELVAVGGAGTPIVADPRHPGYRATFVRVLRFDAGTGKLEVVMTVSVAAPPAGDNSPSVPIVGEFTGDGAADIAFAPSKSGTRMVVLERAGDRLVVGRSVGISGMVGRNGYVPADPIAADIDGDGRADLVMYGTRGYAALMNSPTGLSTTRVLGLSGEFVWQFADVTGDGRIDAVSMWMPPAQRGSTGSDRYTIVRVKPGVGGGGFGAIQTVGRVQTGGAFAPGTYPAAENESLLVGPDIDGDGRADIVYVRDGRIADPSGVSVRERVVALTHAPDGTWNVPNVALGPNEVSGANGETTLEMLDGYGAPMLADFNGDGRADLLDLGYRGVRVFMAT
jgi:hypothetical protein